MLIELDWSNWRDSLPLERIAHIRDFASGPRSLLVAVSFSDAM